MRTTLAAAIGAAVAAGAADLTHASEPAQVVLAVAATGALIAACTERRPVCAQSWLTVRVLLALNLGVFGLSLRTHAGWFAAFAVLIATALLVYTVAGHLANRRRNNQ